MTRPKIKLILFLSILTALALPAALPARAAGDLTTLKNKAIQECYAAKVSLQQYTANLGSSSLVYKNLASDISVTVGSNALFLPAIKSVLLNKANSVYADVNNLCTAINSASNLAAAQNDYNSFAAKKSVALTILNKAKAWDSFYGRLKASGANYAYLKTLADDPDFRGTLHNSLLREERVVDQALGVMETNLPRVVSQMPDVAFYNNLFTLSSSEASQAIGNLDQKISQRNTWLNSVDASYKNSYPALLKAMDLAAQYKVPKTGAVYEQYNKFYSDYVKRAQALVKDLKGKIASDKAALNSLKAKIDPIATIKALKLLDPSVATTLVDKIDALTNTLNTIDSNLNNSISYISAKTYNANRDNLKISSIIIPSINYAISFNKNVDKLNQLTAVYNRFNASYSALLGGLDSDDGIDNMKDIGDLNKIKQNFSAINTNYLVALNGADKVALEQKIKNNAGASPDINSLLAAHKDYSKRLTYASSDVSKNRSNWWKLITQAAINGRIKNFSSLAWVQEENKAKATFESFAKRRDSYMAQARKLIDSRRATLEKNQFIIDDLMYLPDTVRTAVNFSSRTQALISNLEDYYQNNIATVNNYNDLVANVKGLKDFKISEVFIPLESIYITFNGYYKKLSILNAVMTDDLNGLTVRISALENNSSQKQHDAGLALRQAYDQTMIGSLSPLIGEFNTALTVDLVDALVANDLALTKNMTFKKNLLASNLSMAVRKVSDLNTAVKRAEAIK
ncbi:MAG: hypothetical protein WC518_03835 [Patescibacteria group bacterium]